jgi:hypothetical protein
MAASEIALLSPWIFVPLAGGLVAAIRRAGGGGSDPQKRLLLLCLALPAIAIFTLTPLWGARGLPHWPMPGWFFAYPLLGAWIAETRFNWRAWALASTAALALVAGLAAAEARTGFLVHFIPRLGGGADPTLEALNWSELRRSPLIKEGRPPFVVATKWVEAGKIAEALGPQTPVLVFSNDPHGFAFLHDPAAFIGKDAVIIVARKRSAEAVAALAPYFARLGEPQFLSLGRGGMDEIELALIPAQNLRRAYPLPYPPRLAAAKIESAP